MKRLIFILLLLIILPVVTAETHQQNTDVNIRHSITQNGTVSGVTANITIRNPSNEIIIKQQPMNLVAGTTDWNYTLPSTNTSDLGIYTYTICAYSPVQNECYDYELEVTPNGFTQTTPHSIASAIILFVVFGASFLLLLLGFKLTESEIEAWYIGMILIGAGVMLLLYSLNLSVVYANDLSYTAGTSTTQGRIFANAQLVVKILALSFLPLVLLYFYKAIKQRRWQKNKDDGWDYDEY